MFIMLTMVTGSSQDQHDQDIEREGEDDGIIEVVPARTSNERTMPTIINTDEVRNFYPRKKRSDGYQPVGTRITSPIRRPSTRSYSPSSTGPRCAVSLTVRCWSGTAT